MMTPQTVHSFTRESSVGWAGSIRLRCYAWATSGCRTTDRATAMRPRLIGRSQPRPRRSRRAGCLTVSPVRCLIRRSDGDDDLAAGVACSDVAEGVGCCAQRVGAVDDRGELPCLEPAGECAQVLVLPD